MCVQDWTTNGYHGTCYNSPTFNGKYVEFSKSSSEYVSLSSSLAAAVASSADFGATFWINLKTVGVQASFSLNRGSE